MVDNSEAVVAIYLASMAKTCRCYTGEDTLKHFLSLDLGELTPADRIHLFIQVARMAKEQMKAKNTCELATKFHTAYPELRDEFFGAMHEVCKYMPQEMR